jgi:type IV pilus assembly protein PilM
MLFSKSKSVLGLDIGSSSIKILELRPAKGGYVLANFGVEPLPPETIVDSTIMNGPAVVSAIRKLVGTYQVKTKEVVTSISGHSVIIRKITMPNMTDEEIDANIQWEAEQYIPFDINEVNIDHCRLEQMTADQENLDVLLVAVKKEIVGEYTSVIEEAGLVPVVMDVDAFAIQNMFEVNYDPQPGKIVALVNIGASVININIVKGTNPAFTRDISIGGNQYTEEIQKQLNLTFEDAENHKISASASDGRLPDLLDGISGNIALEIQRSLDFFTSTSSLGQISKVYLSGGCSKTLGLDKIIERQVGLPVEVMNPFARIEVPAKNFDLDYIREVAPMAGVAVGLALRRSGE